MKNISRRQFIIAGSALTLGAASAFYPKFSKSAECWLVSACSNKNNEHFIAAIDMQGHVKSQIKLPARGHDVIGLSKKAGNAIVFARRPGNFAIETDLVNGEIVNEIQSTSDSHFYGHGVISYKHNILITTENHFSTGAGRIVVRDVNNYKVLASYPSGGIGPHQLALMPDENTLVIANGGIQTHPNQPRKKLNLDTMKPNLTYLDLLSGKVLQSYELDNSQLSIRHLAVSQKGKVIAGLQYQGAKTDLVPLIISHHGESSLKYLSASSDIWRRMNLYTASVCIDETTQIAVVSCPRANLITYWSLSDDTYIGSEKFTDGAGLTFTDSVYITNGKGRVITSKTLSTQSSFTHQFSDLKMG